MKVLHPPFELYVNVSTICFMRPGVKHSVLKQVGEGLLSARSGAGTPVVKSVYRGGKSLSGSGNTCLV